MKTRNEILKVLYENKHDWDKEWLNKAIFHVAKFQESATLLEISENICCACAYTWGRHEGDAEIMKHRIYKKFWAERWLDIYPEDKDFFY